MKEHPILFSGEMVRAILEGRKTQTRRIVKDPDKYENIRNCGFCYPAQPGDHLWVRETWQYLDLGKQERGFVYRASENGKAWEENDPEFKWKPSIFMPRNASRITLEVVNVRVERLMEISEQDAIAEGIESVQSFESGTGVSQAQKYRNYAKKGYTELLPIDSYRTLWESINGNGSWERDPWVWVIEFKVSGSPHR